MRITDLLEQEQTMTTMGDVRDAFSREQWANIIASLASARLDRMEGDPGNINSFLQRANRQIGADMSTNKSVSQWASNALNYGISIPHNVRTPTTVYQYLLPHAEQEYTPPAAAEVNFDEIAQGLNAAFTGVGTNEAGVYQELRKLRSAEDWEQLKTTYQELYNQDLEEAITDELGSTELIGVENILRRIQVNVNYTDADQRATDAVTTPTEVESPTDELTYDQTVDYLTSVFESIREREQGSEEFATELAGLDRDPTFPEYLYSGQMQGALDALKDSIYGENREGGKTLEEVRTEIDGFISNARLRYNAYLQAREDS